MAVPKELMTQSCVMSSWRAQFKDGMVYFRYSGVKLKDYPQTNTLIQFQFFLVLWNHRANLDLLKIDDRSTLY